MARDRERARFCGRREARGDRVPRPIAVDLFAGAGGLSLGFEQAGFEVAAAVEIDPIHCATYEFNFPHAAVICRDVAAVSGADVRRAIAHEGEIDVVAGGAPCQGYSLIGKRSVDDPRNRLFKHFVRLVRELSPRYFVFENVKGLTIGRQAAFLDEIVRSFEEIGYSITTPDLVLNAAEYGVPQNRERLFIVGSRQGEPTPNHPQPNGQATPGGRPTVRDALGDLPDVEGVPELYRRDWCEASFGRPSAYATALRYQREDVENFGRPRSGYDANLLTSSLLTRHTRESRERFRRTAHGKTEPVSRFYKLSPDGVSNTLRAGTGSDRGAFTSARPIHPFTPRCITNREAARLHSYPDWFRFHWTKWHGFRQIGNSVPPLLARAVASELARAIRARRRRLTRPLALGDPRLLTLSPSEAASRYGVPPDVTGRRLRAAS